MLQGQRDEEPNPVEASLAPDTMTMTTSTAQVLELRIENEQTLTQLPVISRPRRISTASIRNLMIYLFLGHQRMSATPKSYTNTENTLIIEHVAFPCEKLTVGRRLQKGRCMGNELHNQIGEFTLYEKRGRIRKITRQRS